MIQKIHSMNNEKGFVLTTSILILVIITFAAIAAVRSTRTESMVVRNDGLNKQSFYELEIGLVDTFENYSPWRTPTFLLGGSCSSYYSNDYYGEDSSGNSKLVGTVEIRKVTTPACTIGSLSDNANDIPVMEYESAAEEGNDNQSFVSRKFAVTMTSATGNMVLQAGADSVFQNFNN